MRKWLFSFRLYGVCFVCLCTQRNTYNQINKPIFSRLRHVQEHSRSRANPSPREAAGRGARQPISGLAGGRIDPADSPVDHMLFYLLPRRHGTQTGSRRPNLPRKSGGQHWWVGGAVAQPATALTTRAPDLLVIAGSTLPPSLMLLMSFLVSLSTPFPLCPLASFIQKPLKTHSILYARRSKPWFVKKCRGRRISRGTVERGPYATSETLPLQRDWTERLRRGQN